MYLKKILDCLLFASKTHYELEEEPPHHLLNPCNNKSYFIVHY